MVGPALPPQMPANATRAFVCDMPRVAIRRVDTRLLFCAQMAGIKLWINRAYSALRQRLRGLPRNDHFLIDIS